MLYYNICITPGMPLHIVATCADALDVLTRSKNKISVEDIRLPWKPLYDRLSQDLFLTRRQFEVRRVVLGSFYSRNLVLTRVTRMQPNLLLYGLRHEHNAPFLPPGSYRRDARHIRATD